jgi:hypothetical protein
MVSERLTLCAHAYKASAHSDMLLEGKPTFVLGQCIEHSNTVGMLPDAGQTIAWCSQKQAAFSGEVHVPDCTLAQATVLKQTYDNKQ